MDRFAARLSLVPPDLARCRDRVLRAGPPEGLTELRAPVAETIALVEAHLPEVDTAAAHRALEPR
jgi:hypothetical protein